MVGMFCLYKIHTDHTVSIHPHCQYYYLITMLICYHVTVLIICAKIAIVNYALLTCEQTIESSQNTNLIVLGAGFSHHLSLDSSQKDKKKHENRVSFQWWICKRIVFAHLLQRA